MRHARLLRFRRLLTLGASAALAASSILVAGPGATALATSPSPAAGCQLGPNGAVKHVVYI